MVMQNFQCNECGTKTVAPRRMIFPIRYSSQTIQGPLIVRNKNNNPRSKSDRTFHIINPKASFNIKIKTMCSHGD